MNKSVSINVTRVTAFCHASHTLLCICLFLCQSKIYVYLADDTSDWGKNAEKKKTINQQKASLWLSSHWMLKSEHDTAARSHWTRWSCEIRWSSSNSCAIRWGNNGTAMAHIESEMDYRLKTQNAWKISKIKRNIRIAKK